MRLDNLVSHKISTNSYAPSEGLKYELRVPSPRYDGKAGYSQ
jgi:hypothetical protein